MTTPSNTGIGWRYPHYQELIERLPTLDFLEVHSENFFGDGGAPLAVLMQGRSHYPISLHGVGLALGSASGIDEWHLNQLAQLVAKVNPVRVSDHACFARGSIQRQGQMVNVHGADLLPIPFNQEALDVMCVNVMRVQDRLKRSIAIENLSAYINFADSDMPETDFLNQLALRTSCKLLIDVNNIYVNALNDQIQHRCADPVQQCIDWLKQIQPSSVAEIHLAGHIDCGDIVVDDHGSRVKAAVWDLYQHAITLFGAVPTLIEWDTDIPALDVLLDEAKHASQISNHCNTSEAAI
ncbi:MAG TPA: DUF692 domain-containing protein [Burkholderiaceae bacterium]|nr:DUF692 domain-containing protein [Burkholderiaceae bacterium]